MDENQFNSNANPIDSFLEDMDGISQTGDPFGDLSFDEPKDSQNTESEAPAVNTPAPQTENSVQAEALPEKQIQTQPKLNLIEPENVQATDERNADPFAAALRKAQEKSDNLLISALADKAPAFSYGKAKDPITDHEITFEELRVRYETDFPELSESKRVSWSVSYGKVTKTISNPGSDKIWKIKEEIEKSKTFIEGLKKAKTDAEKAPECLVKPHVTAQSKGEAGIPAYKGYCLSMEDARASEKSIVILPSSDGRLYEMRKTAIGRFVARAEHLPEFPNVDEGFEMMLPKIPAPLLMSVLNFFKQLSDKNELEALVHILFDTKKNKYVIRVPEQTLTSVSVHSEQPEPYPENLIHVMDIHSHNVMPARFSSVDDGDEKATRLYAVVGRLDRVLPEITVRASCGGKFIPIAPESVFQADFKSFHYPRKWHDKITGIEAKPVKRFFFHRPAEGSVQL